MIQSSGDEFTRCVLLKHCTLFGWVRSAAVTEKILVKSSITQYYLETAHLILRLRECIVSNQWDQVRAIVMREDLDLPATAMEEVNAGAWLTALDHIHTLIHT